MKIIIKGKTIKKITELMNRTESKGISPHQVIAVCVDIIFENLKKENNQNEKTN